MRTFPDRRRLREIWIAPRRSPDRRAFRLLRSALRIYRIAVQIVILSTCTNCETKSRAEAKSLTAAISDFYASIPVVDDFVMRSRQLSPAAGRLGRRLFRSSARPRRSQGALQGGQHGRRRRHRGGLPTRCDGGRFRSCSAATARASRCAAPTPRGGRGAARRWRSSRARNSRSTCASRRSRSPRSAPAGRDVAWRATAPRPIAPMRCSPAAGWPGSKPRPSTANFALDPGAPGARPDLSISPAAGASRRPGTASSSRVIVAPRGDDPRFGALVEEVVRDGARRPPTAAGR